MGEEEEQGWELVEEEEEEEVAPPPATSPTCSGIPKGGAGDQETPKRQTYRNGNEAKVPSEVRAINSYICVWAVLSLDLNFPISVSPLANKSTCSYSTAGAIVIITDSLRGITHSIQHFPPKPKQGKQ